MQPQVEQNERSSLLNRNWTDDSTLDEIVKYEYKREKMDEYIEEDLELLQKNRLKFLSHWKKVTKEQKKIYPHGLVNLLDEKVGIEQENVRMKRLKMEGRNELGRTDKQGKERNNMEDTFIFHSFVHSFFLNWFSNIDMERSKGRDSNVLYPLHRISNDYNFEKGSISSFEGNQTLRKRK
jgi:hypothetical protein